MSLRHFARGTTRITNRGLAIIGVSVLVAVAALIPACAPSRAEIIAAATPTVDAATASPISLLATATASATVGPAVSAATPIKPAPTSVPTGLAPDALPAVVATMAAAQGGAGAVPTPTGTDTPAAQPTIVSAMVTPAPHPQSSTSQVVAIGDSVMLAASGYLQQDISGISVDAVVGRQVQAGLDVLKARAANGTLGSVVVVHVGNNGPFTAQQFDEMMTLAGAKRQVVVVNDKVPRAWQDANNAVLAAGVKRFANAVLIDWYSASANNPNLFWGDGVHLRPEGAKLYASLIAAQVDHS
jgi:hypothetical protein